MTPTYYAIGDIHGDYDQLCSIHQFIEEDIRLNRVCDHKIVHVGDLVDRRFQSSEVIEFLLKGIQRNEPWVVLKGNHDRLFTMFLENPSAKDPVLRPDYSWLHPRMGGRDTLLSYGVEYRDDKPLEALRDEAVQAVPATHVEFLRNLPLQYETAKVFFCHAGVNPNTPLSDQSEDDLLWIRAPFQSWTEPFEKLIVHGHTPVDQVTHYGNRINIDTGAAWGEKLSAIVMEDNVVWQIIATGRQQIAYLPPGSSN